ncbi:MAG: hypothetical protein ACODAU_08430 [Myxococcota bacterium]
MRIRWMVIGATLALAGACGSEPQPPPEYPLLEEPEPEEEEVAEPEEEPEPEEVEPPPPPVRVVAAERTAIDGKAPQIRVLRPRDGQRIWRGDARMVVRLRNWKLEEAPGNHIHVIVDNEPYIAVRDVRKPLNLNELVEEHLDGELEEGTHVVRTFPSRANHESVKEGTPFQMVVFHYKEKSDDWELDAKAPLLTYSRPKGCYPAGERVLLDFYLTNVEELSEDGHKVRYTIGDVTGDITEWKPHYIENLQEGEHEVRLQLIDPEGEPVEGPFNDTTRTIQVGDCEGGDADHEGEDGEEDASEAEEGAEESDADDEGEGDDAAAAAPANPGQGKGKAKGKAKGHRR